MSVTVWLSVCRSVSVPVWLSVCRVVSVAVWLSVCWSVYVWVWMSVLSLGGVSGRGAWRDRLLGWS